MKDIDTVVRVEIKFLSKEEGYSITLRRGELHHTSKGWDIPIGGLAAALSVLASAKP